MAGAVDANEGSKGRDAGGRDASDGRSTRSQRTRDAVVRALIDLLGAGNLRPTAREIAERAGVSLRSVYVHFDDVEDLFCAAATHELRALAEIMQVLAADGPLDARLDAFVAQRVRVWETLGPVRRAAALQEPFSPALSRLLRGARRRARAEVARVFAAEVAGDDGRLAAADVVASAEAWQHLRLYQGLGVDAAATVVRETLVRVLAPSAAAGPLQ